VAGQSFDLIIAVLGPAIRAVLPPGSELFPGVPLVFCLLPETLKEMKLGPQVAGVVIKLDPKGTLELALKAQPDTRQVVVIAGKSQDDRYVESLARQELREYESRVAFTYLSGLPLEDALKQVTNLPRGTIILYLTMLEDGLGRKLLPMDALARIAPAANAPIYGHHPARGRRFSGGARLRDPRRDPSRLRQGNGQGCRRSGAAMQRGGIVDDLPVERRAIHCRRDRGRMSACGTHRAAPAGIESKWVASP
jgi:hypothetical protein